MNPKRIIIVGGGISGLTVAYRLSELSRNEELPLEIIVLEASSRLGGVIDSQRRDGFLLEGGPDSFISEKRAALNLSKRLGIEDEIIQTCESHRQSFVVRDGRLVPVPKGFYLIAPMRLANFFGSRLLSWAGKLRMAAEAFVPARRNASDESVASFVRRRFGREALERIGQPMVSGIYSADPERLSIQATFPKFQEMEQQYGSILGAFRARGKRDHAAGKASGPRYSLFLSFRNGMRTLVEALIRRMPDVTFRCHACVREVRLEGTPARITMESGEALDADVVCLALSAPQAAALTRPIAENLSDLLNQIPYESVATVNVAFSARDVPDQHLGFGFVVPKIENRAIVGCTFSSVKFGGRAPRGFVLLRVFVGGALHRNVIELDDQTLTQTVLSDLKSLLRFCAKPYSVSIRRFPRSMPQYQVGHLARVAAIEKELMRYPNLFLTGNAYRGIGIPDCIEQAEKTAEKMFAACHPEAANQNDAEAIRRIRHYEEAYQARTK